MSKPNQMKDFLREHDYLFTVKQIYKGCLINIPKNKYTDYNIRKIKVNKTDFGLKMEYEDDYHSDTQEQDAPEYSLKPIIYGYLILICNKINYPYQLIEFSNSKGKELPITYDVLPAFPSPKDKELLTKETRLLKLFLDSITGEFSEEKKQEALKLDVLDGYNLLQKLFTGESKDE